MAFFVSLCAALGIGVAAVGQQYVAADVPKEHALRMGLLVRLALNWRWMAATGVDVVSYVLEGIALSIGSLVLVEAILPSSLLFALPISAMLLKRRLSAAEWAGALGVAGGIALFLVAASPDPGRHQAPARDWLVLLAIIVVVVAILLIAGTRSTSVPVRSGCWATAGALTYAFMAAVTKSVVDLLSDGIGVVITSWQVYALAVSAVLGTLFIQSAFQAGSLTASLPLMVMVEPVSGILIGATVFSENLNHGPVALAAMGLAFVAMGAGVVTLSRSPLARYLA